jgi:hypothetical protein
MDCRRQLVNNNPISDLERRKHRARGNDVVLDGVCPNAE